MPLYICTTSSFEILTACPSVCWRHSDNYTLVHVPQGLSRVLSANSGKATCSCLVRAYLCWRGNHRRALEKVGLVRRAEKPPGRETACEKTLGHRRLRSIWGRPASGGRYLRPLPVGSGLQRGEEGGPSSCLSSPAPTCSHS